MTEIGSSEEEIVKEKGISTSDIKALLAKWQDISEFVEKNHPEKEATSRAAALFDDTALTHFRHLLKGRKKQTSLERFQLKRPASEESEESASIKFKFSKAKEKTPENVIPEVLRKEILFPNNNNPPPPPSSSSSRTNHPIFKVIELVKPVYIISFAFSLKKIHCLIMLGL